MVEFCELCVIFLSTPSARRATFNKVHKTNLKYISIHALCEEGDVDLRRPQVHPEAISIHALCEEGDRTAGFCASRPAYFYPRPLRGGRPLKHCQLILFTQNFYPRPLRGGRRHRLQPGLRPRVISIHALCEEGDWRSSSVILFFGISIHALCEEGDGCWSPDRCRR